MATKKVASPQHIYQIKVTLRGTKPPIWRRLLVPSSSELWRNYTMYCKPRWAGQGGHMHEFRAGDRHFGTPDPEDLDMGSYVENERTIRLSKCWEAGRQAHLHLRFRR